MQNVCRIKTLILQASRRNACKGDASMGVNCYRGTRERQNITCTCCHWWVQSFPICVSLDMLFPRKLLLKVQVQLRVQLSYFVYLECQVTFTATEDLRLRHQNRENFCDRAMWLQAVHLRISPRGTPSASVLIRLCGKQWNSCCTLETFKKSSGTKFFPTLCMQ